MFAIRNSTRIDTGAGQLKWVILLLIVAVVLPTVCLLWFMMQAVRNERLAIRQKLADVYERDLDEALKKSGAVWEEELSDLRDKLGGSGPLSMFDRLTKFEFYDAAVIYDESGRRIYPVLTTDMNSPLQVGQVFEEAWSLEFSGDYLRAAEAYEGEADCNDAYVASAAIVGKSRCLAKLGKLDEAIETCKKLAFDPAMKRCDMQTLTLIANARLFLMGLLNKSEQGDTNLFYDALVKMLDMLHRENEVGSFVPSDQRVFLLRKTIDVYKSSPHRNSLPRELDENGLRGRIATEEISIRSIEHFAAASYFEQWHWAEATFRLFEMPEPQYGIHYTIGNRRVLRLMASEEMAHYWEKATADIGDETIFCKVIDDKGEIVVNRAPVLGDGSVVTGRRFLSRSPGDFFPDWRIELNFYAETFSDAANQQRMVYLLTALFVIGLMILVFALVAKTILRQAHLSKLKNDFIATVTHELKTPLASMRVLADTLLEGRYNDQQQATEYLELICKENARLTGLIDNFLTFSRMERNKQAFEFEAVSPGEIASAAADAVRTKFERAECRFEMQTGEDLPDVLADRDAMVTVLVNLLDNACKYSFEDKRIAMKILAEDGWVCFRVSDKGIGISRKAAKKIFKRFYQVDRSLSRRAEGCGLGLSIAKFIVDAHKGEIGVESEPGRGSTFTVKLPAVG